MIIVLTIFTKNMTSYQIKYLNARKLMTIWLLGQVLILTILFRLNDLDILPINNPLSIILFFGSMAICYLYYFLYNDGYMDITISEREIQIADAQYAWNEIVSYKFISDSPYFTVLKINTYDGRTIKIGHRNLITSDDYDSFIKAFKNKVAEINAMQENAIILLPGFMDSPAAKKLAFVAIGIWVAFIIFVCINGINEKGIKNILMATGLIGLFVGRVFLSKIKL